MTYRGGAVQVWQDFSDDRDKLVETLEELTAVRSPNSGEVPRAAPRSTVLLEAVQMLGSLSENKKALIFLTVGGARRPESQTEVQATIDAAIRANLAIYSIDVRGLVAAQGR
jgi:hypothetical protein